MTEIPYPPVFRDWRAGLTENRVATSQSATGIWIEMYKPEFGNSTWHHVELTEDDACLLAASLLKRVGYKKLSARVLRKLEKEAARV